MARYEHLPIYKAAFDFNVYVEQIARHFSRYHKYTLGTELRERARRLITLIMTANSSENKLDILYRLREELELLKLTLRLCKEVKAFRNFRSFHTAINLVIDISRQNEGWITSRSQQETGHCQNSAST